MLHTISVGLHITAITIAMYDTCQPSMAHTNPSWHSVKTYKVYILWSKQQQLQSIHQSFCCDVMKCRKVVDIVFITSESGSLASFCFLAWVHYAKLVVCVHVYTLEISLLHELCSYHKTCPIKAPSTQHLYTWAIYKPILWVNHLCTNSFCHMSGKPGSSSITTKCFGYMTIEAEV